MSSNLQSAYQLGRVSGSNDVDEDVFAAWRLYMTEDLGISLSVAARRARSELDRDIPKSVLRSLSVSGVSVKGRSVLDLGAGLGGMSEELVLNGAHVTALEPGEAWAALTRRRVERHGRQFQLLNAFGESIPLTDESMDLIVSLQVLEHVKTPSQVLAEAWRVLRPGGYFYLACENYLAFWEPHYQLPWLPMLPKPVGKVYLRMLGRSPKFLEESITYTTFPGVVGACRRLGFVRTRDEEIAKKLASAPNAKWRLMRLLALGSRGHAPRFLDDARNFFKFGIYELLRKPIE
jgi:ubiquinone/menaquinone biosynthesis C-methylase UbiE